MSDYVRLRSQDPVLLEEGPCALPLAFAGISGFQRLPAEEVAEHGWLPYEATESPEFDPDTQELASALVLDGGTVRLTHEVKPLPAAVVARIHDEAKQEAVARVAELRWQCETGGLEWEGIALDTSREGRAALALAAQEGEEQEWKDTYGLWHVLSPEQLEATSRAVGAFKRDCFRLERELTDQIEGTVNVKGLRGLDLESPWGRLA